MTCRPAARTDLHSTLAEPMAVHQGKMPAQADAAKNPRKRHKHKADFFRLCPRHEETGTCNFPACAFAHGKEQLQKRKYDSE